MTATDTGAGRGRHRPAAARAYLAALGLVDKASRWAIIVALAVMTATVSAQVFYRYILNDSIDWADEVSRLMFVWTIFLALPHGLKTGAHVGIDILINFVPDRVRALIFRFTSLASLLLLGIVAVQAIGVAYATWDQPMPILNLSSGVFYLALVTGAVHGILHLVPFALGWIHEPRIVETEQ